MTSSSTFGTLLRQLRKRAGMTQGDLAAAVGYSVSFVSDLEQNRRLPAVAVVLQQFIPALGLQGEANFAAHLVELAALARGERPPPSVTLQRSAQVVVTETFTFAPSRLPAPPTELIGRDHEVKVLCNRLQGHSGRLLTLVGPPGVGKTRLGLAVASQLEALFKDGARFVSLAAVIDPELVATTIANELDLADTGKQSPPMRLIQGLRQKELLLLLDNFEQIIAAAPLLAALLAECPGLYLLVTSRERLHLRAEQRFPVSPLDLDFACALFVQRAQAVDPTFAPTATTTAIIQAICRRLDCLPLAIELIAARHDLFSPQAMLTRLQEHGLDLLADGAQDTPERQRTLRAAIQYSYTLLEERERTLFRTLGVFVGGFDLAAILHFGFDIAVLQGLINKSLVQIAVHPGLSDPIGGTERRFLLLETVRDYAREQLTANQEITGVEYQHAAYYLQFIEAIELQLHGPTAGTLLAYLETEHNNLRSALSWAIKMGNNMTALRLCGILQWFWGRRGHLQEGKMWLEKSLAIKEDVPLTVRAKALSAAGHMEHRLENHAQAQRFVEESLALYQTANDQRHIAGISLQLGGILRMQHHYTQAQHFYTQGFNLFQALEDKGGMAAVRIGLGNLAMNQGDYEQARAHFEQALAVQRVQENKLAITEILPRVALAAFQQGEDHQAILYCEELLTLAQELGDKEGIGLALNQLGRIALHRNEFSQAAHYLDQSYVLAQALGELPLLALVLTEQGNLALAQANLRHAGQWYAQSLQIAHQLTDHLGIATKLESLAGVASAQTDADRATRLLGAAESLRTRMGTPLLATDQLRWQPILSAACDQLDETTYTTAYRAGYTMTVDQAVAFALAALLT